jgi:hypothetical protein
MKRPAAALSFTMAIGVLSFGACASPSAKSTSVQSDVWEITLNAKSHTHSHGSSSVPNEQRLSDSDVTYTLSLSERLRGTYGNNQIDVGDDASAIVVTPTATGTASEQFHSRAEVQRDLQEQWTTRAGTLDPAPGAGAHFAWDGAARQGIFEASAHYIGTETSRTHVIYVGNNVDRTDNSSGKWVQSALFGGDSKHPVTVQQTKTGFTIDWSWTESTRDPSGATKEVDQSGHADVHRD